MTEKLSSDDYGYSSSGYPADFPAAAEEGGAFCAEARINELEQECAARGKRLDDLREKLLNTEIGRRAALLGIPPERAGHISRLAKLDKAFNEAGELDEAALEVQFGTDRKDPVRKIESIERKVR